MQKFTDFKKLDTYTLVTIGEVFPNARSVHAVEIDGKFLILTSNDSIKAQEIAQNNNVCLFNTVMDETNSFTEQRLFATLEKITDISVETYKQHYLSKYPYMENAIEFLLLPFDTKVIFEVKPVKLQITTPNDVENIVF